MSDNLTKIAKNLRKRATGAERLLWNHLRSRQLEGLKFRRQEQIGNYLVDFVCFERRLVIEIDGGQHALKTEKDRDDLRDEFLKVEGFKVFRFWNNEVLGNIDGVLEVIRKGCLSSPSPLSPPIKGGE